MTRILHLTDLHFGAERAELIAPLTEAIRAARPELLAVTGDLSHRGRPAQLAAALAFLKRLGLPFTAMPGNHDIPLYNLPSRLIAPFRPWRNEIGRHSTADCDAGALCLHGANTADPFSLRRGIFRETDLTRILSRARRAPAKAMHVLTCHHPLIEPPGFERGETRGARAALQALARAGIRITLSGHTHHWAIGLGITATAPQPMLMVQTGTALCGRADERDHGFSLLEIGARRVEITPWIVDEATLRFVPRPASAYFLRRGLWHLASA